MITIVDYGMGNLGSVVNMFKRIGASARVSSDVCEIGDAEKLLLPGVGAFAKAMKCIEEQGLREVLNRKALQDRIPILGICLGMQLLTRSSEEGNAEGLGWISASAHRFPPDPGLKIPHMGWNSVVATQDCPLTANLPNDPRFYFVHSYYVRVDNEEDSILKSTHGVVFDAAIRHDNIFGAQFHPEKSHKFGMQLLANFAAM